MKLSNFAVYVKQAWKNKPDTSTPLSAERLRHIEDGIKGNSDAIEAIAAAVVNQIVNDPNKIASMAALYAVNQKIGDVSKLPNSAADVVTAITKQNSDLIKVKTKRYNVPISAIQDGVSKMYTGSINFSNDKPSGKILSTIAQPASYKNYTNGAGITTMIAEDLLICGTLYPNGDTWLEIDVIWLYN